MSDHKNAGAIVDLELVFVQVVKQERVKSQLDQRVWVWRTTAEYRDQEGGEYRKGFEVKYGTKDEPVVPLGGTHELLNSAQYQWAVKGASVAREIAWSGKAVRG